MFGELKVVASADLNGLGPTTGLPVSYRWSLASLLPVAVPWVTLLVLFTLMPNRNRRAWWILAPLAWALLIASPLTQQLDTLLAIPSEFYHPLLRALAFGHTALWLLAGHLASRSRFSAFLGRLACLAAFSGLAWAARFNRDAAWTSTPQQLIVLGLWVLVAAVALTLAAWTCRRRYRPVCLSLWLLVWTATGWTASAVALSMPTLWAGGGLAWRELLPVVKDMTLLSLLVLLPFLALAFANPFYRERLSGMLRLTPERTGSSNTVQ